MRKPASTERDRENRNATAEAFSLPRQDDLADEPARAARQARVALEALLADAPSAAAGLPAGFSDAIERYVALLLEANQRTNLTRLTQPDAVARLHLLDALSALALLDATPGRAVDLGSGGGVPAIPLALARPGRRWTLVDPVGKKADALRAICERLGLTGVMVLAKRAEVIGRDPAHRERYGLVTARACAPLPVLVELALPLLRLGGSLVAWKGPLTTGDEEWTRGQAAARQLGGGEARLIEPGLTALGGHRFVVIGKERATDRRFPRRAGEPTQRPLA
ncbi:MAG: 16S rRNA (guanine(527)-N(7))-methyltransferase RsmG [Chloroflexi bacterium]|nr:MAG: 16S rRNA (guanine(527)-N(7))-methyltransferase RsmG [Chloroflexota bacterium]